MSACLFVCLFVRKITQKLRADFDESLHVGHVAYTAKIDLWMWQSQEHLWPLQNNFVNIIFLVTKFIL